MLRRRLLYKNLTPVSVEFNSTAGLIGYVGELAGIPMTNGIPDNIRSKYLKVTYSNGTTGTLYASEITFAVYAGTTQQTNNFNKQEPGTYAIKLDVTNIGGVSCNLRTTNSVEYKIIENKPYTIYWRMPNLNRNDFYMQNNSEAGYKNIYVNTKYFLVEYLNGAMKDGYWELYENDKKVTNQANSVYFTQYAPLLDINYPIAINYCMPGYVYGYAHDSYGYYGLYGYEGYCDFSLGFGWVRQDSKTNKFTIKYDHYSVPANLSFVNRVKSIKSVVVDSIFGIDPIGISVPDYITTKIEAKTNLYIPYDEGPYNFADIHPSSPWLGNTATGSLQYTQFNFTDDELNSITVDYV